MNIGGIFIGERRTLEPEGTPTGLFKRRADGPVQVTAAGIPGDFHGDPRVHGGPDKALHHYHAGHYAGLGAAFPAAAAALVPGALGENLSGEGLDEHSACIGDIYRIGSCTVQLSQPRRPCWKINHRFDLPGLSAHVEREAVTGWYYRVLEAGRICAGDTVALMERSADAVSVAGFVHLTTRHRPSPAALDRLAGLAGLADAWRQRLAARRDWLARQA